METGKIIVFESYIEIAICEYERYLQMIESYLVNEENEIRHILEQMISEDDTGRPYIPPDLQESFDGLSDDINLIASTFISNFRNSLLIQILSFVEGELRKICAAHSRQTNSKYVIADLSGGELEKCKTYLIKSANVNFANVNTEWEFICKIYKHVRNRIVHHSSVVSDKSKLTQLQKCGLLKIRQIDGSDSLFLERQMNEELLKNARAFFKKLLTEEIRMSGV